MLYDVYNEIIDKLHSFQAQKVGRKYHAVGVVCLLKAPIKDICLWGEEIKTEEKEPRRQMSHAVLENLLKFEMWCNKLHKDIQIPCSNYVIYIKVSFSLNKKKPKWCPFSCLLFKCSLIKHLSWARCSSESWSKPGNFLLALLLNI